MFSQTCCETGGSPSSRMTNPLPSPGIRASSSRSGASEDGAGAPAQPAASARPNSSASGAHRRFFFMDGGSFPGRTAPDFPSSVYPGICRHFSNKLYPNGKYHATGSIDRNRSRGSSSTGSTV